MKLSQFSGNYLNDNDAFMNALNVGLSQPLKSIRLTFATVDYHGVGEVEVPTMVKSTAYLNSISTPALGSATARGALSGDTYSQGTLSFESGGRPFNLVVIGLVFQSNGATYFMVDNMAVSTLAYTRADGVNGGPPRSRFALRTDVRPPGLREEWLLSDRHRE